MQTVGSLDPFNVLFIPDSYRLVWQFRLHVEAKHGTVFSMFGMRLRLLAFDIFLG